MPRSKFSSKHKWCILCHFLISRELLLFCTKNSIPCVLGDGADNETGGDLQTTDSFKKPLCGQSRSLLMLKSRDCCQGRKTEPLERRNRQWEGESQTDEDFHPLPKVKQQVWGWCTAWCVPVFTSNVPYVFLPPLQSLIVLLIPFLLFPFTPSAYCLFKPLCPWIISQGWFVMKGI